MDSFKKLLLTLCEMFIDEWPSIKDIFDSWNNQKNISVQLTFVFVHLVFVVVSSVVIFCKTKIIVLFKQTWTDITLFITFYELALNKHSVSNQVKDLDWPEQMLINAVEITWSIHSCRSVDSCCSVHLRTPSNTVMVC